MLHHQQVKNWQSKEERIRHAELIIHRPARPDENASPAQWARYQQDCGIARRKEAEAWSVRKRHNQRWGNIAHHLSHRQNVKLYV